MLLSNCERKGINYVRLSAFEVLREKPIWVETFWIRKVFWSPVREIQQYRYVIASRNDVITYRNKEHTADSTSSTRDLSHWTLYTIKLVQIADEYFLQMRPGTVNTTG